MVPSYFFEYNRCSNRMVPLFLTSASSIPYINLLTGFVDASCCFLFSFSFFVFHLYLANISAFYIFVLSEIPTVFVKLQKHCRSLDFRVLTRGNFIG